MSLAHGVNIPLKKKIGQLFRKGKTNIGVQFTLRNKAILFVENQEKGCKSKIGHIVYT
jgi:hypothetical protein